MGRVSTQVLVAVVLLSSLLVAEGRCLCVFQPLGRPLYSSPRERSCLEVWRQYLWIIVMEIEAWFRRCIPAELASVSRTNKS